MFSRQVRQNPESVGVSFEQMFERLTQAR